MIWPFIGEPSGTWAGSMERSHDIRSRARETKMAAITGRATSNRPSRMTSRWPAAIASSTTIEADQYEEPSPGVSSRHGRDMVLSPVGNVYGLDGLGDDVGHRTAGELGIGGGQHPMRQDGDSKGRNVVRGHIVPARTSPRTRGSHGAIAGSREVKRRVAGRGSSAWR